MLSAVYNITPGLKQSHQQLVANRYLTAGVLVLESREKSKWVWRNWQYLRVCGGNTILPGQAARQAASKVDARHSCRIWK